MAKLTPSDWANIVTAIQRGEKTPVELAESFGVELQTITKGLRERGVTRTSQLDEGVDTDEDEGRKEHEERIRKARSTQESYAQYNDAIAKMAMRRVIEGDRDGTLKLKGTEMQVLKMAGAIVAKARQENWEILRIEDLLKGEDTLPDLNVGEYTHEEIEQIRQANEDSYLEAVEDEAEDEI